MVNAIALQSTLQIIVDCYSQLPQVEAIALSGSQGFQTADAGSDLDIYVYVQDEIPLDIRRQIATARAERADVGNQFWEPGDEWVDAETQLGFDVMYRSPGWIEDQMQRVLKHHQASVGYSTCFWHNVLHSKILSDRNGWYANLQQYAAQPYPEPLQRAIIAKNYPILKNNISAYLHQLEKAVQRQDLISINHRVAALLASYFDILFAINRMPHPGEKRLLAIAQQHCQKRPPHFQEAIDALFSAISLKDQRIVSAADSLIDELTTLLQAENLL